MPVRKKKTPDQIMKANLAKMLGKMKLKVADKEEIWLELFQMFMPLAIREDDVLKEEHVMVASRLADVALSEYEGRWGG